ncbi:MAG: methyltransferase domain-containing protein [Rhodospirillaceae bacterium]|nr:methyltransferase domain-containing protein [Rhodospirillaceae bacterium]
MATFAINSIGASSMADEAKKTNKLRPEEFFKTYLSGRVLDIGAGDDPVVHDAQIFDQAHGDANRILDYLEPEQFDCVHSSHCLEHMFQPINALKQWWSLVKPGGYMITVVPHEDLYEQYNWPPIFNKDHKASFRVGGSSSWSPVSVDILSECGALPNSLIVKHKIWDNNYDYDLQFSKIKTPKNSRSFWNRKLSSIEKRLKNPKLKKKILIHQLSSGYPIDQTARCGALAQIEVICRKTI